MSAANKPVQTTRTAMQYVIGFWVCLAFGGFPLLTFLDAIVEQVIRNQVVHGWLGIAGWCRIADRMLLALGGQGLRALAYMIGAPCGLGLAIVLLAYPIRPQEPIKQ